MTHNKGKKDKFEKSLIKLEEIVSKLESEELTLEESLEQFKDGIGLYKECKDLLSKAEKKIRVLTEELKEENL